MIRHAQSTGPAPDAGLSPAGEAQAIALADRLRAYDPSHLYSSPFPRAMATLAPFAEASGMGITVIHTLRERHLADADLPDWQDHVARSFDHPDYAAPGGESHNTLHARLLTGLARIAGGGGRPVAASHGKAMSCLFHRIDPDFGFARWQAMRNPHLYLVTLEEGVPVTFQDLEE